MACQHHHDELHTHGPDCGHIAIAHDGHVDYLHDGHLHHPQGGQCNAHELSVTDTNPDRCTGEQPCGTHVHGPGCGHEPVPHGDHIDYLVDGRLHHPHAGHCDDHGPVTVIG